MNTFDFTAISSQLPPNTGPPGTVPTNSGNGSSANTNKNLSHVPCKFYRQGICQAGNSCPFSHNFEGSLAAEKLPCKYFQKGNCKFGLKCALAHYLPDGTRVNPKSLRMSQPINTNMANGNSHLRRSSNNTNNGSFSHYTSQPIDINAESIEHIGNQNNTLVSPSNNVAQFLNVGHKFPSQPGSYTQDLTRNSSFNSSISGLPNSYTNGNTIIMNNNLPVKSSNQTSAFFRSYSNNTSPPNQTASPLYNSSSNTAATNQSPLDTPFSDKVTNSMSTRLASRSSFSSPTCLLNYDSAVVDDEDEEMYNDSGYFEDYVPGSLSDLILTPQEMQRRDSRSQSGTLLVRPNLNSTLSSTTNEDDEKKDDSTESKEETNHKREKNQTQDDVFLMD